jgi:hypothetical protein
MCVNRESSESYTALGTCFGGEESVGTRKYRSVLNSNVHIWPAPTLVILCTACESNLRIASCLDVKSSEDAIVLNNLNELRFPNALLDSLRLGTKVDVDHKESTCDCFFDMQFKSWKSTSEKRLFWSSTRKFRFFFFSFVGQAVGNGQLIHGQLICLTNLQVKTRWGFQTHQKGRKTLVWCKQVVEWCRNKFFCRIEGMTSRRTRSLRRNSQRTLRRLLWRDT